MNESMTSTQSRQKQIERVSFINIAVNVLLSVLKIVVGLAANSLAIVSEGINSASDAASSLLTLIGAKLSVHHPDKKHPFGYGRVEYLVSLVVSVLICYTGITLFVDSVKSILHPEEMSVSVLAIVLVAVSAVAKFFMGVYTIRAGKKLDAQSLLAIGLEGRGDSYFSLVTIAVSVLYLLTGISLDAWAGLLFAVVIFKAGFNTFVDTISELLGRPGEKELADKLYKEIRGTKGILFAVDMMLHNYGPGAWSGSVNVEVDHAMTVGEAYNFIHELQLRIMHEYNVTMVFGIYAVDNDSADTKALRKTIAQFLPTEQHVKSFHAVYLDKENSMIYCDFMVDYDLRDWDGLQERFLAYMKEQYPEYTVNLTIETDFV